MGRRSPHPPLAAALALLLLIGGAEAWRVQETIELHRSETIKGSRLAGGRGAKQSSVLALSATAGTVDPIFLGTAVGLSALANIANVVLHAVRISRMEGTRTDLVTIQEQIFAERADACFSVRSLEVQADLLTRAIEAFVEFTGAQVPEKVHPLTISDGKLGREGTANATASKAVASDVARISKSLQVVNSHLRHAMAAAVQSACHSAASGEIVIQANVDKLSKQIEEAQEELMSAGFHLISDLTGGVLTGVIDPTKASAVLDDLDAQIKRGNVLMSSLAGLGQLATNKWEVPSGMSSFTWKTMIKGIGTMWTATTAIAITLQNAAVVDIVVQLNFILESLYNLVTGKSAEGFDIAIEVLSIVNSALRLVNDCVSLASPGGQADPSLLYVTLTISTLSSVVRLAKTSLQLQQEQGQQSEMIAQAQSTKRDATLLRSYGTCNALGTAWTLSGTAGTFMREASVAAGVSLKDLDAGLLTKVYERYAEERPSLAAKVLREALSLGTPGVTKELIQRAEALAEVAPITDFAVASDRQQLKALGALGLQPTSTVSHKARFLICRGCGDSVITGMKLVVDDEMYRGLEEHFNNVPAHFGDLRMPSDSTLNFVQLPRQEGFSMIAFAKVPRTALATHALPVLFDLSEEVFATEAHKLDEGAPATFREKAMAMLQRNEVEVLSWKTDQTYVNKYVNKFINGGYCDAHPAHWEFGILDVVAGRFLLASPDEIKDEAPLRSLVPAGLFRPGHYVTVTKGCGCRMGRLGNPYRAGALGNVAKWWMAIEDDFSSLQLQRCQWRYDVWISEKPLVDVGTVAGDGDPDLGCTISYESRELPEPVDDLSQLVEVSGYNLGTHIDWHWEQNDRYGVGTQFPGSRLLYNSQEAVIGPAGPPSAIDDDGCNFTYPLQIWRKPPAAPEPSEREAADSHLSAMVADFQESLGSVLCSARCAFGDLQSVPRALERLLGLPRPAAPLRPRFVPHQRGTSKPCGHVQEMLMPQGFPADRAGFVRSGLGEPTANGSSAGGLLDVIERIYREDCDFEATLLLHPAPCAEGHVPDLRLGPSGLLQEACVPRAAGGSGAAPLHRYAVAWDLSYHSGDELRGEEEEVESNLTRAGFSRWGEAMMLSSPRLNTDTWYWRRSLRQRIFVQRDPRVTTASGAEVCRG